MKIRYNIASCKKVNYVRYILASFIVVLLSLLFVAGGIFCIASTSTRFLNEKKQLKLYKAQVDKKTRDEQNFKKDIDKIKKKWNPKISFANSSINSHIFPYINRLETIEELLPGGVFVTHIVIKEGSPSVVFQVVALSSDKMMETYKAFSKYSLVISSEVQKDGSFNASLEIKL